MGSVDAKTVCMLRFACLWSCQEHFNGNEDRSRHSENPLILFRTVFFTRSLTLCFVCVVCHGDAFFVILYTNATKRKEMVLIHSNVEANVCVSVFMCSAEHNSMCSFFSIQNTMKAQSGTACYLILFKGLMSLQQYDDIYVHESSNCRLEFRS